MNPRIRTSRGLRARAGARRKTPRFARTAALDRRGLVLDGHRFQYFIGPDVDVTTHGDRGPVMVTVGILADRFDVPRLSALPRHATVTLTQA